MVDIPFIKKLQLPSFSWNIFASKPTRIVGIDIGLQSAKVIQLKYQNERAILESYGELLSEGYLKTGGSPGGGFLRYADTDIAELIKDVLKESNISTTDAVFSVPATSSFITTFTLPRMSPKEIEQAIPFEARKYVPIPIAEVVLDWDVMETTETNSTVLLVAVPREIIDKFKRIADMVNLKLLALEVETFSMVRSLIGPDQTPTLIVNFGHQVTTLVIADHGKLRVSHNISRGAQELTRALEQGLNITKERAEAVKREIGIDERIEEQETTSILSPLVESLLSEIERIISLYNRKAERKIQKISLTGGGSNLKGLIDHMSIKFGVEVARGNPFARVVTPAFMQPMLREIGPIFSVATGLALHEITTR